MFRLTKQCYMLFMDPGDCHLRITYGLDTGNSHQRRAAGPGEGQGKDRGRTGEQERLALALTHAYVPVFTR